MRDSGHDAYRNGAGTFHPKERRIVSGSSITGSKVIKADACVIGTGAGGAAMAKELAEAGLDVVMLEAGPWWDTSDYTGRPFEMIARAYDDAGLYATIGDPPILLPTAKGVGGTTIFNSGTCFRVPGRVLENWQRDYGLEALTEAELEPYFRRVERIQNVSQVPPDIAGRNNNLIAQAAEQLGWSGDYIYRNAKGCVGSGMCVIGCPSGAKQHAGITYVPQAWDKGATTYTECEATRLEQRGNRTEAVIARTSAGGELRVEAEWVAVAAGTLNTPLLLQRSGLGTESGWLGKNLAIHPCAAVWARFDDAVDQWNGVPQSYYVDEFADQGFVLEGAAGPPDYIGVAIPADIATHYEWMRDYRHIAQYGLMICDSSRGSVRSVGGRPVVTYNLLPDDTKKIHRALVAICGLFAEAGARDAIVPVAGVGTLDRADSSKLRAATVRPQDLQVMAFHPLGTARAGSNSADSVVDQDLRLHGSENVLVTDGSAVPSALGVNPQITISALAARAAFVLTDTPPPVNEPAPTQIPQTLGAREYPEIAAVGA